MKKDRHNIDGRRSATASNIDREWLYLDRCLPRSGYSGKEKTCPSFLEAINRKIAMSMLVAMN
jgi:hypothetical protein